MSPNSKVMQFFTVEALIQIVRSLVCLPIRVSAQPSCDSRHVCQLLDVVNIIPRSLRRRCRRRRCHRPNNNVWRFAYIANNRTDRHQIVHYTRTRSTHQRQWHQTASSVCATGFRFYSSTVFVFDCLGYDPRSSIAGNECVLCILESNSRCIIVHVRK